MTNKYKLNNYENNLGLDAGSNLNNGQKLCETINILRIFMLLSKRPEMFLPNVVAYFQNQAAVMFGIWIIKNT